MKKVKEIICEKKPRGIVFKDANIGSIKNRFRLLKYRYFINREFKKQRKFFKNKIKKAGERRAFQSNQKFKEFTQLLDYVYLKKIEYKIIDFNLEEFDCILEIENERVGVEITQTIHDQSFKEFSSALDDFINDILSKLTGDFLLEINLTYSFFYKVLDKFKPHKTHLEKEIFNILNEKPFDKEIIRTCELKRSVGGKALYFANTPNQSAFLSNDYIEERIKIKEAKLARKSTKVKVDKKWLLFHTSGWFYDNYLKIDRNYLENLEIELFDEIIFVNLNKGFYYQVVFE